MDVGAALSNLAQGGKRHRQFNTEFFSKFPSAIGHYLSEAFPLAQLLLATLNTLVSLALFTLLFGAIYSVLPDTSIAWRDVATGGFVTAAFFTAGKSLIGWYLGRAAPSSGYGAAGALIVLLLWTYYSSQIFLFGAEITKAIVDMESTSATTGSTEHSAD